MNNYCHRTDFLKDLKNKLSKSVCNASKWFC